MRTQLGDVVSLRQLEPLENFKEEQRTRLIEKSKQHRGHLVSDLKEIKREIARENSNAKAYTRNGSNKRQNKQLDYYKQSLKKLHDERTQIVNDIKGVDQFSIELKQQLNVLQQEIESKLQTLLPGRQYTADESLVGEKCGICFNDIEKGMNMRRLSCNCEHVFCRDCVVTWLTINNNCPNCRHSFD